MLEYSSLLNLKFLMLLYSYQYAINFCSLMLFFPLVEFVLQCELSIKNVWINNQKLVLDRVAGKDEIFV